MHPLHGAVLAVSALLVVFGLNLGSNTAASAQSATTTTSVPTLRVLTVRLQVLGPRPGTVFGYAVTTTCRSDESDPTGVSATQGFSSLGGVAAQYFTLGPASGCIVGVVPSGTGGAHAAVSISIGGTVRAYGPLNAGLTMTPSQFVSVTGNAAVDIVISYPSFAVKVVTVGTEITPGADYLLALVCSYNAGPPYARMTFRLRAGVTRTFTDEDIPGLIVGSKCRVTELESNGAPSVKIEVRPPETGAAVIEAEIFPGNALPGINPFVDANFIPPIKPVFASGQFDPNRATVTITNAFVGDVTVSKVVSGSPRSNIAIYELQLACNDGAVKDTFLLKNGQTWLRSGLLVGWTCTVFETRSDGAVVSFADNSGPNATDGRVTVKSSPTGCTDASLNVFPDCRANVIVTNDYPTVASGEVSQTTSNPPQPALAVTPVPTTVPAVGVTLVTAPPVAAAPVEEPAVLDETEETVG